MSWICLEDGLGSERIRFDEEGLQCSVSLWASRMS